MKCSYILSGIVIVASLLSSIFPQYSFWGSIVAAVFAVAALVCSIVESRITDLELKKIKSQASTITVEGDTIVVGKIK